MCTWEVWSCCEDSINVKKLSRYASEEKDAFTIVLVLLLFFRVDAKYLDVGIGSKRISKEYPQ